MRKIFYLILTVIFILLLFRLVDVGRALELTTRARWTLIILAVFLGIIQSFIGAFRLRTLLKIVSDIPVLYLWPLGYVAALLSLVFPFSLGGFAMAYFLAEKAKITYKKSFAIIFVDAMLAVILTFVLSFFAVIYFYNKKLVGISSGALSSPILVFFVLLVATFILVMFARLKKRGRELIVGLLAGMKLFTKSKAILAKSIFLTFILAILGFVQFYLYFIAFGMRPPAVDFILANSLFAVLGLIPGAFAKIGQYETFGVLTLPYLLDLNKDTVFAILLVKHFLSITLIILGGIAAIYYLKLDLSLVKKLKLKRFS